MVLIESIGPGTPRKLPPMTAGAMTTSVHDRHRLDAILSPRASTVPKPPSSWQVAKPRKEDPAPFRSWGWHERNAEAVKLAIQQAVNLALAQQQAAGERAAIRNEELAKASARALEKVKASATKVAAERAAFEARQLELQEQYKERRRKEVQEYLDNQERQKAEKQAMIEQVHALLQLPVPKPKPSPLTLRRLRAHAAAAQTRRQSFEGWRMIKRNMAEERRQAALEAADKAAEEAWVSRMARRGESARKDAADRGKATHQETAAKASRSNRLADEKACQWFEQAEEEMRRKEERQASLLSLSEAAAKRQASLEDWSQGLSERMTEAAEAAEERRAEVNAEKRRDRLLVLKELQAEKTRLREEAEEANERPPDDSYCAVDEYLAKLLANARRRTFQEFARQDRERVQVVVEEVVPPMPEEEIKPKGPNRWIPATKAARLGLEMHRSEQELRKSEATFWMQRKHGAGSRS